MDEIKHSDHYLVSFYESMNKITQNEQLDISMRFWNELTNLVDMDNILQVLMDGPSVNWTFYNNGTIDREQLEILGLKNIESCGLHVLQGLFITGVVAAGWGINKLFNVLFQ